MTISITTNPSEPQPVFNHETFTFTSTNDNEDNFNFIVEVSAANTYEFEIPLFNGIGHFNPENVLLGLVNPDKPERQVKKELPNHSIPFQLDIYESYTDSNGNQVKNAYSGNPLLRQAQYASRPYGEPFDTDKSIFSPKMDSDCPYNDNEVIPVVRNQPKLLTFKKSVGNVDEVEIETFDSQGGLNSASKPITNDFTVIDVDKWFQDLQGNGNYQDKFYLNVKNTASGNTIHNLSFLYECVDQRVEPITLAWINPMGGYDSHTFTLNHIEEIAITKDTAKLDTFFFSEEQKTNRGLKNFGNSFSKTLTLRSNWIRNCDLYWLKYMFTSPEVYMWYKGEYHAVVVNQDELQTKFNNKLFNLQAVVEFANNDGNVQKV